MRSVRRFFKCTNETPSKCIIAFASSCLRYFRFHFYLFIFYFNYLLQLCVVYKQEEKTLIREFIFVLRIWFRLYFCQNIQKCSWFRLSANEIYKYTKVNISHPKYSVMLNSMEFLHVVRIIESNCMEIVSKPTTPYLFAISKCCVRFCSSECIHMFCVWVCVYCCVFVLKWCKSSLGRAFIEKKIVCTVVARRSGKLIRILTRKRTYTVSTIYLCIDRSM